MVSNLYTGSQSELAEAAETALGTLAIPDRRTRSNWPESYAKETHADLRDLAMRVAMTECLVTDLINRHNVRKMRARRIIKELRNTSISLGRWRKQFNKALRRIRSLLDTHDAIVAIRKRISSAGRVWGDLDFEEQEVLRNEIEQSLQQVFAKELA